MLMLAPAVPRSGILAAIMMLGLALPCTPATSYAQATRGTVVDEWNAPVTGAVVLLLDSALNVVMRSLTNDRGEYRLLAPRDGEYRIRTLRIGFRPTSDGPFTLQSGAAITQRLALTGLPVSLATVSVIDKGPCRSLGDSTAATFLAWEQVRTALTAAQLTEAGRPKSSTTVLYERLLDPRTMRVSAQSSSILANVPRQPWRPMVADSLHSKGYIVSRSDGSLTYYAPGLEVLLSDMFLEDHCFRLQRSPDPERIGIEFEPIPARKRIPEIRGTVWIDRTSAQLRSMEFGYTNTTRQRSEHAGGRVDYARMSSGEWVIAGWEIRMPMLQIRASPARRRSIAVNADLEVGAIKVDGGELVMVREGTDTIWSRRPEVFRGAVIDSSSGKGVPGARVTVMGIRRSGVADAEGQYSIDGVLYGGYTVEVTTASLDSVADVHLARLGFTDGGAFHEIRVPTASQVAATACAGAAGAGGASTREPHGMIAGIVHVRGDSNPQMGAWVTAEWTMPRAGVQDSAPPVSQQLQEMTDARGMFRFCGIPMSADVSLRARAENHTSTPVAVRIPPGRRFAHIRLTLDPVR